MSDLQLTAEQAEIIAGRPIPSPIAEGIILKGMGQANNERNAKRHKVLRSLQLQGSIKPATILNLSPFVLDIGSGLIQYKIPACQPGKAFSIHTVKVPLTYASFRGNQEMSDKRIKPEYDIMALTPIEQLMQFQRAYGTDLGFEGVGHGGIVIFSGDINTLKRALAANASEKDKLVDVPAYKQEGFDRYLVYEQASLPDLVHAAEDSLKGKALSAIREGNNYQDQGPEQRKNIDPNTHYVWADWALNKQWITQAPAWRHMEIHADNRCDKCGDQYVSKTGVCKCGFVKEPLLAYQNGEIGIDHVRMDTLNAAQWKKAKEIQEQRKANRGEQQK